jgi:hypothetical protein
MKQNKGRYSLTLDMAKLCGDKKTGLFYYKYRVQTEMGAFDMRKKEHDLTETYMAADDTCGDFQLLVYEKRKNPPIWLYGGVFYQIFPDRFFSAGNLPVKEDAVLCNDIKKFPEHLRVKEINNKNNVFFGGDLPGITAKLDYLESMGVTCLYLNPIFESSSNHRYNTADYSRVDSMLGNEQDLQTLIDESKKRGIAIILDGVFNHTGSDSIYFNKNANYPCVGAVQSEESQYAPWYTFTKYPTSTNRGGASKRFRAYAPTSRPTAISSLARTALSAVIRGWGSRDGVLTLPTSFPTPFSRSFPLP